MKSNTPNVLLVDDSSTNNLLLESALKRLNFKIFTALSGEEALTVLKKKEIDLVLLDIMMPGMSGYDVLETMAKNEKLKKIPVILVTARNQHEEEARAKELGVTDFFEKPLKLNLLIDRINELIHFNE
ncbi:MAG: response regulator [Bacteroidetes bacterium HGW-Bacteroidetes-4]|jgi:CheY-like chemotaxis protein|nr:MAG: response regulator [Bacteroidetes bacterium HGW-Bacteroidetes-4]